jgi:hypothetical protein
LRHKAESSHNVYQTIQIMVLQSMALDKQGRGEEALVALEKVVALSERLGWIWPFMEAGAPMAGLLEHLLEEKDYRDFVARLLKTLDGTGVRHATSATGVS